MQRECLLHFKRTAELLLWAGVSLSLWSRLSRQAGFGQTVLLGKCFLLNTSGAR